MATDSLAWKAKHRALDKQQLVEEWGVLLDVYRKRVTAVDKTGPFEESLPLEEKKGRFETLRESFLYLEMLNNVYEEFEIRSLRAEPPEEGEEFRGPKTIAMLSNLNPTDEDYDSYIRALEDQKSELQDNLEAHEESLEFAKQELGLETSGP